MEGNASKDEMYRIFSHPPSLDAEMTYHEQRALAMWVCIALPLALLLVHPIVNLSLRERAF